MKTGAELKARRLELKITQQDLADEIGVSRTQLSRMESGKIGIPIEIRPVLYDSLYTKHEQPKLKFSDLEVGDYVYVRDDLVEYQGYGCNSYVSEIGNGIQQIKSFHSEKSQFITNKSHYWVTPEMLNLSRSMKKEDYLKMNEKEIASFEELQYVANKALYESIIEKYEVCIGSYGNKNMIIHFDGKFTEHSDNSTNSGIEFIQSLYTEEFVIECEDDIKKVVIGANIHFMNGKSYTVLSTTRYNTRLIFDNDVCKSSLGIQLLKGATVKQSKGTK